MAPDDFEEAILNEANISYFGLYIYTIDDALMLSKRFPIFQKTSEAKHHPRQKP